MMTAKIPELENRIDDLLKENRMLEESIEALETEIRYYTSTVSDIEETQAAIKQKLRTAYDSGAQFKLVRSLHARMGDALEGPEYSDLMNDIYFGADELRAGRKELMERLDENESMINTLRSEINTLQAEVQDGC